ncbi:MAG: hypothetical protein U0984_12820 [Prosthecobacter sp.]|nr:hypothetical protein [Prosthecobacter sp.]
MPALIEVKLAELAQLFNSMDPSPFHERDLDQDAEEFIVSWAQEHPRDDALKLVIHLAKPPAETTQAQQAVEESVRHYFDYRAEMLWREFRQLMKEGRSALLIGLVFMAACLFVSSMIFQGDVPWKGVVREGFTILGWVAMWRPLDIYLYRWWPLLGKRRLYERLARMTVEVRCTS